MSITAKQKARLKRASAVPIAAIFFANLTDADKRFLAVQGNRYRERCTQLYDADLPKKPKGSTPGKGSTVDHDDMAAYVAASGPAHAIDGWSFLGRSVDACLRNDAYNAIHLAYYAELRAAMALLATEGVGILNSHHTRVSQTGRTSNYGNGATHSHIWPCLNYWASCRSSFLLLESVFQPAGRPLSHWFGSLGASTPARAVARQFLRMWGLDLRILADDHNLRNQVSYRPSEFYRPSLIGIHDVLSVVCNLWECVEPSSNGRFLRLESGLLGRALRAGSTGNLTAARLQLVGLSAMEANRWASVLLPANEPQILNLAAQISNFGPAQCPLEVVARATLLLALATAAARRHIAAAGYTAQHLAFWWQRHGESRGLWSIGGAPADPIDAWADIKDRLDEVTTWRQQNPAIQSFYDWRRQGADAVELFGAFELVAIWGLMP